MMNKKKFCVHNEFLMKQMSTGRLVDCSYQQVIFGFRNELKGMVSTRSATQLY